MKTDNEIRKMVSEFVQADIARQELGNALIEFAAKNYMDDIRGPCFFCRRYILEEGGHKEGCLHVRAKNLQ